MMPDPQAVFGNQLFDVQGNFPQVLQLVINADGKLRLIPQDRFPGSFQRLQLRTLNIHFNHCYPVMRVDCTVYGRNRDRNASCRIAAESRAACAVRVKVQRRMFAPHAVWKDLDILNPSLLSPFSISQTLLIILRVRFKSIYLGAFAMCRQVQEEPKS